MKKDILKKSKALFLLIVFSLNTIIGFACSLGIDMGFNSVHCHDEITEAKPAHHHNKEGIAESVRHHHSNGEKDNCCNDGVIKFQKFEKNVTHKIAVPEFNIVAILPCTFYVAKNEVQQGNAIKYFIRKFFPPPRNIRIDIQSFQI